MTKKKFQLNTSNLTAFLILGIIIIIAGILFARIDPTTNTSQTSNSLRLFFIANAGYGTFTENLTQEGTYSLTLQNTSPALTYIARNPDRYFGSVPLSGFVSTVWGDESPYVVQDDYPNAVLTALDPTTGEESVIELEISDPQIQGSTIEFTATEVDKESGRQIKSFFDTNLTDFPPEFTNPILIIDLSASDIQGNMLEVLNSATGVE